MQGINLNSVESCIRFSVVYYDDGRISGSILKNRKIAKIDDLHNSLFLKESSEILSIVGPHPLVCYDNAEYSLFA